MASPVMDEPASESLNVPAPESESTCDKVREVGAVLSSTLDTSVRLRINVGAVLVPGRTLTVKLFATGSVSTPPLAVPPLSRT